MVEQAITCSFLDYFSHTEDPRLTRMQLHSREEILLVTLVGYLASCDGWAKIDAFAKSKIDFLRTFLPFPNGCPSDDTCRRFFRAVDPKQFQVCFLSWIECLRVKRGAFISIDEKTRRGSRDDADDKNKALHLVSAFASEARLVLAQETVSDKSNEISAIPILLRLLDLKGATVTIDAMGCQRNIAAQIQEQEGDYIFGLKGNQENLCQEVEELFNRENVKKKLENMVAISLLKNIYGKIDYEAQEYTLHYLRTKDGHEVDFALVHNESVEMMVEVKLSNDKIEKSLSYFQDKYQYAAEQIVKNLRNEYQSPKGIKILNAEKFLSCLFL